MNLRENEKLNRFRFLLRYIFKKGIASLEKYILFTYFIERMQSIDISKL